MRYNFWRISRLVELRPRSRWDDYFALAMMVIAPILAGGLTVMLYTTIRHMIR